MAAFAVVAGLFLIGLLAPLLAPYDPGRLFIELIQKPKSPLSPHHLLGTDVLSHDFLTELLYAIRETMLSAFVCAACATAVGTVAGAVAGYYGGWFSALTSWATGVIASVPALALLIVIGVWSRNPISPLGYGLWLTPLLWTGVARVVAATIASLRTREYVEAAAAAGASGPRILLRHLLPNAAGEIIVAATAVVAQSIVIVATADYLYYAYNQASKPTLGGLVSDASHAATLLLASPNSLGAVWWLYAFPTSILVVLLLALMLLGDELTESLLPQGSA